MGAALSSSSHWSQGVRIRGAVVDRRKCAFLSPSFTIDGGKVVQEEFLYQSPTSLIWLRSPVAFTVTSMSNFTANWSVRCPTNGPVAVEEWTS